MARMTSKGTRRTVLVTGGAGYVGSHACKARARADDLLYKLRKYG